MNEGREIANCNSNIHKHKEIREKYDKGVLFGSLNDLIRNRSFREVINFDLKHFGIVLIDSSDFVDEIPVVILKLRRKVVLVSYCMIK